MSLKSLRLKHTIGDRLDEIVSRSPLLQRWPIDILPNHPSQWFIRNYKSDSWVTDDLWGDEWVYVIKSGLCVVAKAIDELEIHRSGLKRLVLSLKWPILNLISVNCVGNEENI